VLIKAGFCLAAEISSL